MRVRECCSHDIETVPGATPVHEAAELMHRSAVGSLIVVDEHGIALGIVTDRDLCLRTLAPESDARRSGVVAEVMSQPLQTVSPDDELGVAARSMRTLGVRRMPVCEDGRPIGLLSLDDLLEPLAGGLMDLGIEARTQRRRELRRHRAEHVIEELEALRSRLRRVGWWAREEILDDLDSLRRSAGDIGRRSAP